MYASSVREWAKEARSSKGSGVHTNLAPARLLASPTNHEHGRAGPLPGCKRHDLQTEVLLKFKKDTGGSP